jgi:outer membrane receptor protein involved in Fe transport
MRVLSKTILFCTVAAAALTAASAARAQSAPAGASSDTIETVVVTASRRAETVQTVAGQVTALTGDDLSRMHANSFADFAYTVPGLSYESGGPTNNLIAIRGVTTGGTQLGSAVGLYLDDVPLGASTQFGLGFQSFDFNVFDLDRVEVLNGPQGTLYGANALGGAIRYITVPPDLTKFDARVEAEGSSTEHGSLNDGLRAMVNIPLFDGHAALRVDGIQEYDSGYTQDPTHNRKDLGSARTLGGRVSFLAQITPDIDVRLSAFTQNIQGNGADVSFRDFVTHLPVAGPYDQSYVLNQPSDNSVSLYSGVANWNLDWAKLTSITSYQYNHGSYESDLTPLYDFLLAAFGVGNTPFGLPVVTNTKKFTQEVRLTSPDNKNFEWVVGGYYTHEVTNESVDLVDGATATGKLPVYNALPFFGFLPSTYRELAVYADGTYFFTDDIDLTLGVRYSQQRQNYQSNISTLLLFPNYATVFHYQAGSNQGVATYIANPRWRITDDTMLYARVSSGFRPGGPNFVLPPPFGQVPPSFKADKLWNYELGEKSTLLDGKATFDFDIYDIEWHGMQATDNVGGINQLVNAGNARVQGAETSFNVRVTPQLTIGGSGAYTDARLTTPSPVLGVLTKGARLPLSPKYDFALDGTYTFDLGGGYAGAVDLADVFVGDRNAGYPVSPASAFGGTGNPLYRLGAYNTVNAGASLFTPNDIEVDLYIKNVFDTRGEVSASTVSDQYLNPAFLGLGVPYAPVPVELSQPRTIGIVLKADVASLAGWTN